MFNLLEKRGTGIFLMKERSKVMRSKKNKTTHKLSMRLTDALDKDEEMKMDTDTVTKRRKEDGKILTM